MDYKISRKNATAAAHFSGSHKDLTMSIVVRNFKINKTHASYYVDNS
jgi:hypothetical protein